MKRWHCYTLMLLHQATWLCWVVLAVTIALAVVGFIFSPWIGIAALGFDIFIVMMALSFSIMVYGFNSITGVNTLNHSFHLDKGKIRVEFEDGEPVEIDRKEARPYHIYPGGVLIPVAGVKAGWLWLPPKAFESDNDFQTFLKEIYND